jgi:NAD(P)-dependent dehydrogenase (short-subunit alcohol dehydrogenase family)
MTFHGKVAMVTGAASGMGQISARRLADAGADVAAVDVNDAGLAETARGRESVRVYHCDVADEEAVNETVKRAESECGQIDRVTHAAAIMPTSPLADADAKWIRHLMCVNYEGTVNITLATLPAMLRRRSGDLIIYGSLAGHVLAPHLGAYSATKAAINAFSEVLIHENAGSGVRILLVCPPMTDTPLIQQATSTSNPRSVQQGIREGRMADPEFIVSAIEEAIEKGKTILFPGREAKILFALRRYAPKFLWKVILKSEASGG